MFKSKSYLNAVLLFLALDLAVFKEFFIKHLYPFPGSYLLAWFEPWKSDHFVNGVIQIAHKPVASDIFRQIYPLKILSMDIFKTLQFPLWNPYNGAGMPLLATLNMGFLDPLNITYLIMSYPNAWTANIIDR